MLLAGRVAIVTGAGSGIGRAIALTFAGAGARVLVTDIQDESGRATVDQIVSAGGEAAFVRADVSIPGDHEALVREAVARFGALHVAVNNAGIGGPQAPVGEYPIEGWDQVVAVNLSGVFYGMRHQLPAIQTAGGGAIVNVASILAQVGYRNAAAYAATKHGIVGLTQSAALEYAPHHVRVNVVGPGFIMTPMIGGLAPDALQRISARHALGRVGEPSEVAELVLWLCSEKASFVTGSYYPVDGGYLAE